MYLNERQHNAARARREEEREGPRVPQRRRLGYTPLREGARGAPRVPRRPGLPRRGIGPIAAGAAAAIVAAAAVAVEATVSTGIMEASAEQGSSGRISPPATPEKGLDSSAYSSVPQPIVCPTRL